MEEEKIDIWDLRYRFENESQCGVGYYSENITVTKNGKKDKTATKLWKNMNKAINELKNYLENNE